MVVTVCCREERCRKTAVRDQDRETLHRCVLTPPPETLLCLCVASYEAYDNVRQSDRAS